MTLIVDIKGNALDDGPGIRSVVFFKGCPLRCGWCHNPEGIAREAELSFDASACVACDTCIATCTKQALARSQPGFIDREACDLCMDCVETCPSNALSRVGEARSVDEVMAELLRHKVFYDSSGGGVTFSGGEPTLFMGYLGELARALKDAGVHTLLETCGLFAWERFEVDLLPHLDTVYFDLKLMDDDAHRRHCGASNKSILENFQRLQAVVAEGELELLPRMPLVPGITATEENVRALAELLQRHDVKRARLLGYNPLWPDKLNKLGARSELARQPEMKQWIPRDQIERFESILRDAGIDPGNDTGGER